MEEKTTEAETTEAEKSPADPVAHMTVAFDARQIEAQTVHEVATRIMEGLKHTHDPDFEEDDRPRYSMRPSKNLAVALRAQVKEAIAAEVSKAFDDAVREELRAHVKAAIQDIADRGMPTFNRYGEKLEATPWPKVIAEALEGLTKPPSGSYGNADTEAKKIARTVFENVITKAVTAELEEVRKRIRTAVDEQLSGSVIKALREAVGLRS